MPHKEALQILKDGNERFITGETLSGNVTNGMRTALVKEGQAPLAAIIGCADSRAPLETVFDAMPGDIFVLRNAGNTCTHAEGSMIGSLEFCVGALGTKNLDATIWGHMGGGSDWYEATTLEPSKSKFKSSRDAFEVGGTCRNDCGRVVFLRSTESHRLWVIPNQGWSWSWDTRPAEPSRVPQPHTCSPRQVTSPRRGNPR